MDKTTILTDEQVEFVVENTFKAFGFDMAQKVKLTGFNLEPGVEKWRRANPTLAQRLFEA